MLPGLADREYISAGLHTWELPFPSLEMRQEVRLPCMPAGGSGEVPPIGPQGRSLITC